MNSSISRTFRKIFETFWCHTASFGEVTVPFPDQFHYYEKKTFSFGCKSIANGIVFLPFEYSV